MHFMAQVLIRLTKMGFISWVADEKDALMTKIGQFKIRVYKTQLPVDRWILKGKKIREHYVLEIDDNGLIEKSVQRYVGDYTPVNCDLLWEASRDTEKKAQTTILRDLHIEIGNVFGINLLKMEV